MVHEDCGSLGSGISGQQSPDLGVGAVAHSSSSLQQPEQHSGKSSAEDMAGGGGTVTGGAQPPGGLGKGKSVWKEAEDKGIGVRGISLFMRKSRSSDDNKRNASLSPDNNATDSALNDNVADVSGSKDARKPDSFQARSRLGSIASALGNSKFVRGKERKKDNCKEYVDDESCDKLNSVAGSNNVSDSKLAVNSEKASANLAKEGSEEKTVSKPAVEFDSFSRNNSVVSSNGPPTTGSILKSPNNINASVRSKEKLKFKSFPRLFNLISRSSTPPPLRENECSGILEGDSLAVDDCVTDDFGSGTLRPKDTQALKDVFLGDNQNRKHSISSTSLEEFKTCNPASKDFFQTSVLDSDFNKRVFDPGKSFQSHKVVTKSLSESTLNCQRGLEALNNSAKKPSPAPLCRTGSNDNRALINAEKTEIKCSVSLDGMVEHKSSVTESNIGISRASSPIGKTTKMSCSVDDILAVSDEDKVSINTSFHSSYLDLYINRGGEISSLSCKSSPNEKSPSKLNIPPDESIPLQKCIVEPEKGEMINDMKHLPSVENNDLCGDYSVLSNSSYYSSKSVIDLASPDNILNRCDKYVAHSLCDLSSVSKDTKNQLPVLNDIKYNRKRLPSSSIDFKVKVFVEDDPICVGAKKIEDKPFDVPRKTSSCNCLLAGNGK